MLAAFPLWKPNKQSPCLAKAALPVQFDSVQYHSPSNMHRQHINSVAEHLFLFQHPRPVVQLYRSLDSKSFHRTVADRCPENGHNPQKFSPSQTCFHGQCFDFALSMSPSLSNKSRCICLYYNKNEFPCQENSIPMKKPAGKHFSPAGFL